MDPFTPYLPTEENFLKWFRVHRPDVILAGDHRIISWLRRAGYRVPEDVGFASLNVPHEEAGIAGTCQNSKRVGAAAVDLVVSQLHRNERGIPATPHLLLIPSTWVNAPTIRMGDEASTVR